MKDGFFFFFNKNGASQTVFLCKASSALVTPLFVLFGVHNTMATTAGRRAHQCMPRVRATTHYVCVRFSCCTCAHCSHCPHCSPLGDASAPQPQRTCSHCSHCSHRQEMLVHPNHREHVHTAHTALTARRC